MTPLARAPCFSGTGGPAPFGAALFRAAGTISKLRAPSSTVSNRSSQLATSPSLRPRQLHGIRVFQTHAPCFLSANIARGDASNLLFPSHALSLKLHNLAPGGSGIIPRITPSNQISPHLRAMAMSEQQQLRAHSGHSHSHHHHHDNVYLTSSNKNDAGVRITRIGLIANLGMALAKGVGGYVFHSQSMIADAWHSLTDLASDVLTLATVSWSLRPPSDKYPSGFGKVESLGSLGVSGMLLGGGVFMGIQSCETLFAHFFLDAGAVADALAQGHGHGHSHGHGVGVAPSLNAAWLALGTVVIKEWLYHATMKVAKERKSSVLASNAIHHRVDSWTGIVTLAVIVGANFIADATWLDPVGGLLISLLVIRGGWSNTLAALYELADRALDEEVKNSVRKQAEKSIAEVSQGHDVDVREISGIKSGQNYLVDVELAVPGGWTVEDVREVETAVRERLGTKIRGVKRVRVRFVPKEITDVAKFDEFIHGSVSPVSSPEPDSAGDGTELDELHAHDHGHEHEHSRENSVDSERDAHKK